MLYTIEEEKKKSSGRKPGGNRCSIWEIVTPFYFYPLTGIFPFTLVEKHILIQLHKRNTCHYSDTFGAQGAYNRSHDHFFFVGNQQKKNTSHLLTWFYLKNNGKWWTHCFLRQVIGQTLLALKLWIPDLKPSVHFWKHTHQNDWDVHIVSSTLLQSAHVEHLYICQ